MNWKEFDKEYDRRKIKIEKMEKSIAKVRENLIDWGMKTKNEIYEEYGTRREWLDNQKKMKV